MFALTALLLLFAFPCAAKELRPSSTGAEWVSASGNERLSWGLFASSAMGEDVSAADITLCLAGALGFTGDTGDAGATLLRGSTLSELSALCATSIHAVRHPSKPSPPDLSPFNQVTEKEVVIGKWVDESHPCGVIVITELIGVLGARTSCSEGKREPLVKQEKPSNGVRSWQTAGKRKVVEVDGEKVYEYYALDGSAMDASRYVEANSGNLLVYEYRFGEPVGQSKKPYIKAKPVQHP